MRSGGSLLVKKMAAFVKLSEPELAFMAEVQSRPIHLPRGRELVHEGQPGQSAYILQSGWGCSFKLLPDGGRQIITFPVPGDCLGLRSMLLRTSDHAFSALTDAVVTRIESAHMSKMFADYPYLGAAILWAMSRDEAMLVEHLVSVGRRSAIERTAHFFLELYDRLSLIGLAHKEHFSCPLNQYVIADALGLSTIHVNRVLRQLRDKKLMTFKAQKIIIHDLLAMKELAGYESPEAGIVVARENSNFEASLQQLSH